MSLKVAITGNIGSGKSYVCRIFEEMKVPVYYADLRAKMQMDKKETIDKLVDAFGSHILADDQTSVDRKALAAIVFTDANALRKLNNIMHQRVADDFEEWQKDYLNEPFILHEAAILYESGFDRFFDKVVFVSAPESIRLQRVLDREDMTEAEVQKRMDNQWPEERKIAMADFVLKNDGEQMLLPQIIALKEELDTLAKN